MRRIDMGLVIGVVGFLACVAIIVVACLCAKEDERACKARGGRIECEIVAWSPNGPIYACECVVK
jgi:hypothetical protein